MLLELKVANFAIIDNLHIQFGGGLNILSGETGAGKSVLLKSLGLLMGQKGNTESIRTGSDSASIEGIFDIAKRKDIKSKLQEMGIPYEEDLLVVRRVLSEEKSRVYLNGSLSTLNTLRDIVSPLIEVAGHSSPLIEMTGQHENRNLLSKTYHLDLLDHYCGCWDQRNLYHDKYTKRAQNLTQIEQLEKESQIRQQRIDFLQFQINEISSLDLEVGEEALLETEIKKLKNTSRINTFVDGAETALYSDDDSAIARLHAVIQKSQELSQVDPLIQEKIEGLTSAKALIEDSLYDLRHYASKIEGDPGRLEKLEERLSSLRKLQKKYGKSAEEILSALDGFQKELSQIENSDALLIGLKKEISTLEKELTKISEDLHKRRTEGAKLLASGVNDELLDLNMKGVRFHVQVQKQQELGPQGVSDVEFMSQTSPKDPVRPLAKFASGGELSRILLSLKRIVGSSNQPRTYLFDEVDTGVSGPTAEKVGKKLKSIAKGQQVICVTHLPQVAACGDQHYFIQKSSSKNLASMEVSALKKKERVQEIARLISGEKITKTSLAHAEQLLNEPHG